MKIRNIFTVVLTVIFFVGMIILTAIARPVHEATLPKVTAERLTQELFSFEYTDENGNVKIGKQSKLAMSSELAKKPVFVVYQGIKNGEKRDFVREVQIITGAEENGFLEVVSGIGYGDMIIIESNKELKDNDEVYVQQEL